MSNFITREVKIGVVTIMTLVLLYFGINYLKGINIFQPSNHYVVQYDNVDGLALSNPVYVEGFKVGLVHSIEYDYENIGGPISVILDLDKSLKVPTGSKAELYVSVLGSAHINLHLNKFVTTLCRSGEVLEGFSQQGLMDKVQSDMLPQLEKILPRIDSILTALHAVVSSPAVGQTLNHISATTKSLELSSAQLNRMMRDDVPTIMSNFKTVSTNFATLSSQFSDMNLASTLDSVQITINQVNQLTRSLNNPTGTVGLLLNDRQLYDNLNSTASSANELVRDLKENPKRYVHFSVFGIKEKSDTK